MLTNDWAIMFNLLSVALIGLLAATMLLVLVGSFALPRLNQFSVGTQKITLWLFLFAPWAVSIICVLLFVPSMFRSEGTFWLERIAHWHHPNVFYLDSWHGATLLFFILGFGYVLVRNGLKVSDHLKAVDTLTRLSRVKPSYPAMGRDITVLESRIPSVFTAGLLQPQCFVTTGLIEQVSATELNIIVEHERAHIRHHDTRKKFLYSLFASLYPKALARRLNHSFSLATEQLADAEVSKSHCALEIAETLIRTARIQHFLDKRLHPSTVSYFIASDVESRVRALVSPQRIQSFPWAYCLLVISLTTIISSNGVDALHHLVEAVFSH